jgi:predicted PurR-regulated permease PerM
MSSHGRSLILLAALVVCVAGLHYAQAFFVPVLLAAILAALTSPLAASVTRRGAPPLVGALVALLANVALVFGIGLLLARAASDLQEKVPAYLVRLSTVTATVSATLERRGIPASPDMVARALHMDSAAPVVGAAVAGVIETASTAMIILVIVFFALVESVSIGEKLRGLLTDPESGLLRVEGVLREVRSYLLVKTLTSFAEALIVFILLSALRVDLALFLATLMFILHFIPNVGVVLAAIPAILVAFADRGTGVAAAVAIGYASSGMLIGNFIEPRVLGRTMGLSPLVVFVSMLFWGFLWGPAGAVLSVPLTMVAKIVLKNDPEWAWIARLLGPSEVITHVRGPRKLSPPLT